MIVPGLLAVLAPVATGLLLGVSGLAGLLTGALVTGVLMALMMANAGGVWDNAKKYIEEGHHGGKGSEPHKAAVIGDTVGDPFKDTSGPSLNILIKLMSIVAVIFAPLSRRLDGVRGGLEVARGRFFGASCRPRSCVGPAQPCALTPIWGLNV